MTIALVLFFYILNFGTLSQKSIKLLNAVLRMFLKTRRFSRCLLEGENTQSLRALAELLPTPCSSPATPGDAGRAGA